jgi:hypothetical protein
MLEMRYSLAEPIPEVFDAATSLSLAVDAHLLGKRDEAAALIRDANCPKVWAYIDAGWGKGAKARYNFLTLSDAPLRLPVADRPTPRMPTSTVKAHVKKRDQMHCRFCGMPVIDARVRKAMMAAYPDDIQWPNTDIGKHGAFMCLWLQYDHILPNSRGGDSSIDNIVVTCTACNFGRMETTLEEARLLHPLKFSRPKWVGFGAWDGLERFAKAGGSQIA